MDTETISHGKIVSERQKFPILRLSNDRKRCSKQRKDNFDVEMQQLSAGSKCDKFIGTEGKDGALGRLGTRLKRAVKCYRKQHYNSIVDGGAP